VERQQDLGGVDAVPATAGSRDGVDSEALRSFYADRNAEIWDRGDPVHGDGPQQADALIRRFSPQNVPAETWARVEDSVRDAVRQAAPDRYHRAAGLLNAVSQFALWADTVGLPTAPEQLFQPALIDRFVIEGPSHLQVASRMNYRTILWRVGQAVQGTTLFPDKPASLGGKLDAKAPYTQAELAALISATRALGSEHLRRNCFATIVLGLGAGLHSREMSRAVGTDVSLDGDILVIEVIEVIEVIGEKARTVPVHLHWEEHLRTLAEESGSRPLIIPTREKIRDYHMTNLCDLAARRFTSGTPRLSPLRLRNTWIVGLISAGVPLIDIAEAAGITPGHAAKYAKFAGRIDPSLARRLVRGESLG
jgi:hypothetical protein